MLHVYEIQRAINDLVAKLCKAMLNPDMHKEICGHMHALLYETPSVHGVGELEQSPCGILITPSLFHEEEHNGLVMLHVDSP